MKRELEIAGCKHVTWAMWTWDLIDYGEVTNHLNAAIYPPLTQMFYD
jgi:hypothetical protein